MRNTRVCELDEEHLNLDDIGRAYEAGDKLVPILDQELDDMPLPTARTIEISGFVELAQVPREMYDKPYFLAPASAAANKPYVLMRDALAKSGKAAVGKYAVRGSENLGIIHAYGDVLVLERLHWADEVRAAGDAAPKGSVDISADEQAAAEEYIHTMGDVDMQQIRDEYAHAVEQMIEAKTEGKAPAKPARPAKAAATMDLMAALQEATEQARRERGEDSNVRQMTGRKKAAKKAPAKKATRKRAG